MLIWILLAAMLVMALFPQTEIAKTLRRWLVEIPAERLNRLSPRQTMLSVIGAIALLALMPLMIEIALPMEMAMVMAGDIALYVEAASLAILVLVRGRGAAVLKTVWMWMAHRPAAARALRSPASRRGSPKPDDPEPVGLVFA